MKAKIGELFLVLGTGLFIAGAIGFMARYLSQDQTAMFLVAPLGISKRLANGSTRFTQHRLHK